MNEQQYRVFKFTADVIDGQILEFPKLFELQCDKVKPIGRQPIRQFDGNECINVIDVYLIQYGGQLLGNKCYTSTSEFLNFLNAVCFSDYLLINKEALLLDDCGLILN